MRGRTGCGAVSRVGVPLRHSARRRRCATETAHGTLTAQGAGLGLGAPWRLELERPKGRAARPSLPRTGKALRGLLVRVC